MSYVKITNIFILQIYLPAEDKKSEYLNIIIKNKKKIFVNSKYINSNLNYVLFIFLL